MIVGFLKPHLKKLSFKDQLFLMLFNKCDGIKIKKKGKRVVYLEITNELKLITLNGHSS